MRISAIAILPAIAWPSRCSVCLSSEQASKLDRFIAAFDHSSGDIDVVIN